MSRDATNARHVACGVGCHSILRGPTSGLQGHPHQPPALAHQRARQLQPQSRSPGGRKARGDRESDDDDDDDDDADDDDDDKDCDRDEEALRLERAAVLDHRFGMPWTAAALPEACALNPRDTRANHPASASVCVLPFALPSRRF